MKVFAIDPGTEKSAWVIYDTVREELIRAGIDDNAHLLRGLREENVESTWGVMVIEMMKSYGNVMGDSVLQTCVWIGRFSEACNLHRIEYLHRKAVVTQICNNPRAKDSNVRAALIDKFGGPGCEKKGGVLAEVKKDMWSALAVAVAWAELQSEAATQLQRGLK